MNRNPKLDELVGTETTGAERERLQHVHDLLLEAGPPPELSPELEAGPNLKMTVGKRRRVVKQRAMLLLAAAVALSLIFLGGYAVGNNRGSSKSTPVVSLELTGTPSGTRAEAASRRRLSASSSQARLPYPARRRRASRSGTAVPATGR